MKYVKMNLQWRKTSHILYFLGILTTLIDIINGIVQEGNFNKVIIKVFQYFVGV